MWLLDMGTPKESKYAFSPCVFCPSSTIVLGLFFKMQSMDLGVPNKCRCMSSFWNLDKELIWCYFKFIIRSVSSSCFSATWWGDDFSPETLVRLQTVGALCSLHFCLFPVQHHRIVGLRGTLSFLNLFPHGITKPLQNPSSVYISVFRAPWYWNPETISKSCSK